MFSTTRSPSLPPAAPRTVTLSAVTFAVPDTLGTPLVSMSMTVLVRLTSPGTSVFLSLPGPVALIFVSPFSSLVSRLGPSSMVPPFET